MNAPEILVQGSPEWYQARAGRATASCFAQLMAKGEGKTRAKYLRQVLAERLTGKPVETYHNGHMDRGQEQEPFARMAYEDHTGAIVREVGFIPHPELMAGCSPDGLINSEGGAEIKSVIPTVHVETMMRGKYPPEHRAQIQGSLWLTKRQWWDFCSYCPDMPERLQLYVFRVERDEKYIETLAAEVCHFLQDVDEAYAALMGPVGDALHPCTQA
jgi:hypothetical protein